MGIGSHPVHQTTWNQNGQAKVTKDPRGSFLDSHALSSAFNRYQDFTNTSNKKAQNQSTTSHDRRDKTMKALKYIQKHKHLYASGSKDEYKEIKKKYKLDDQTKTMKSFRNSNMVKVDVVSNTYLKA